MARPYNTANGTGVRLSDNHSTLHFCIREVAIIVERSFNTLLHFLVHSSMDDIAACIQ